MWEISPGCVLMSVRFVLSCLRLSRNSFPRENCLWNILFQKVISAICGLDAPLNSKMWRVSSNGCRRSLQKIFLITALNVIRRKRYGFSASGGWMIKWDYLKLPVLFIPIIIHWVIQLIIIMVICFPAPDILNCSISWSIMTGCYSGFRVVKTQVCSKKLWSRRRCWMYLRSISTGVISWDLITPATLTSPAKKGTLRI